MLKKTRTQEVRHNRQQNMHAINDRRKDEIIRRLKDEIRDLRLTKDHMRLLLEEHNIPFDESDIDYMLPEAKETPGRKGYDDRVLTMSELIYNACPKALEILRQYPDIVGELPCPRTLQRRFGEDISTRMEALKDVQNIAEILSGWREQHQLGSQDRIPCILSVDAINFKPFVQIDPDGNITGIDMDALKSEMNGSELYETLKDNLHGWEDWVRENYDHILCSAFVFYLQPLDPRGSCLAVHWHETTSGKATEDEVKLMLDIVRILQLRYIKVVGLASDADGTYEVFHKKYLRSYAKPEHGGVIEAKGICEKTKQLAMICDPLHLLKRMRYRLLKGKVFTSGFDESGPTFDSSILLEGNPFKNVPDVVLRDGQMYKMHDSLPLVLFTPEVLLQAVELDPVLTSYLLPGVLLNVALSYVDLTREERIELLTIGYYYMLQYYVHIDEGTEEGLVQTGTKKVNLLFSKSMARHLLNNFRALAFILRKYDSIPISLNRCGTTPLEHCFGVLRVQCSFVHNLVRCLRSLAVNQICADLSEIRIAKRVNSYGCIVDPTDTDEQQLDLFVDSSDVVAEELFKRLNYSHLMEEYALTKTNMRVVASFWRVMEELNINPRGRKRHLTLKKLTLGVCSGLKGRHMTQAKSEMKKIMDPVRPKVEIRNERVSVTKGDQEVLEKLRREELSEIIARTCREVKIKPPESRLRKKEDLIRWIVRAWKHTRGVLRNWIEEQQDKEEQGRIDSIRKMMKKAQ